MLRYKCDIRKPATEYVKHTKSIPRGFWTELPNQRKFLDDLGKKLGIQKLDDWYEKVTANVILQNGGATLLDRYQGSPLRALMAAYPEHNWIPWKLRIVPMGFWNDPSNQRKFFDHMAIELGIKTPDEWYTKITANLIAKHGGRGLLRLHNWSPSGALMSTYPDHSWIPWKFDTVPRHYWKDKTTQQKFFDDLGFKLGIKHLDEWYERLTKSVVLKYGGRSVLKLYNDSPAAALMAVYPQHNWIPWKFHREPTGLWNSKDNISRFLSELSEKLSIQTLDDWYRVDLTHLRQLGAATLISKYGSLYKLLKQQYPHHPWDLKKFQQKGRKAQRWLVVTLQKIFPDDQILEDYIHPKAVFPSSNRPMQLDVFIPSRSLAFEYQGIQHYQEVGMFSPSKTYQQRDEEKRALCDANNIKLIEVPYWWNRTQESLQEMINK